MIKVREENREKQLRDVIISDIRKMELSEEDGGELCGSVGLVWLTANN